MLKDVPRALPHFDGKRFHNVPPVPEPDFADVLRWKFTSEAVPWDEALPVQPTKPSARVDGSNRRPRDADRSRMVICRQPRLRIYRSGPSR